MDNQIVTPSAGERIHRSPTAKQAYIIQESTPLRGKATLHVSLHGFVPRHTTSHMRSNAKGGACKPVRPWIRECEELDWKCIYAIEWFYQMQSSMCLSKIRKQNLPHLGIHQSNGIKGEPQNSPLSGTRSATVMAYSKKVGITSCKHGHSEPRVHFLPS